MAGVSGDEEDGLPWRSTAWAREPGPGSLYATADSRDTGKNLSVTLDPCLSYFQHISTLACTCQFFLSKNPTFPHQLRHTAPGPLLPRLLQLPPGWPPCIRHPSAPAHPELHWLPITARIQFKTLVLTYRCLDQTTPSYLQTLISPYTVSLDLSAPPALEDWLYLLYAPLPPEPAPSPPSPHSGKLTFLQMSGLPSP
ncbi:UNVERIFIED_CONTAM: hypothetical protein FKN15_043339 [Acipenser sinensis]